MNQLKVINGTIYTHNGAGTGIDNLAMIYNIYDGYVHKYGENKDELKDYYESIVSSYRAFGLNKLADSHIYLEFDRYNDSLTIEEICTFANYLITVNANLNARRMLDLDIKDLKNEIIKLKEFGF